MTEAEWLASTDPQAMLAHLFNGPPGALGAFKKDWPPPSPRKLRLFAVACARQVWHLLTDDAPCSTCDNSSDEYYNTPGKEKDAPCSDCSGSGRINRSRRAVEVAERYADGEATEEELHQAEISLPGNALRVVSEDSPNQLAWVCCWPDISRAVEPITTNVLIPPATQANLFRDIVGNPFRPVTLPHASSCPSWTGPKTRTECGCRCDWLTPTILSLAQAAYDLRQPERVCGRCDGGYVVALTDAGEEYMEKCPDCHGTGKLDDGCLDPARLAVLADALVDAGCPEEVECKGGFKQYNHCYKFQKYGAWWEDKVLHQECGGSGKIPNPLLAHLRSPEPHVRGCHVIDALLGKE